MKEIVIDGLSLQLIRSKRKTLGLEISSTGIKARAPRRMSEHDIISFVRQKRNWIDKHVKNLPDPKSQEPLELISGSKIQLRGQSHTLEIQPGSKGAIKTYQDRIVVPIIPSHLPLSESVKSKLVRWYKATAQHELQTRARYYAALMQVPQRRADQIYVRDYKRRWGSCDSKGKLSFNWRILQAPTMVSDYVIVHELAHCHEFNHSKRFWSIVATQMPDYKQHEQWLSDHGHELYRF